MLQFLLNGAISMLWNIFNTLQIIIAIELLAIIMPANVQLFYEVIKDTINFQPLPKDVIYNFAIATPFGLEDYDELTAESKTKATGENEEGESPSKLGSAFKSASTLVSILFILIAVVFITVLILLLYLCRMVMLRRCHRKVVNVIHIIEGKLMYNAVLRALLETYLSISIAMWYGWRSRRVTS